MTGHHHDKTYKKHYSGIFAERGLSHSMLTTNPFCLSFLFYHTLQEKHNCKDADVNNCNVAYCIKLIIYFNIHALYTSSNGFKVKIIFSFLSIVIVYCHLKLAGIFHKVFLKSTIKLPVSGS